MSEDSLKKKTKDTIVKVLTDHIKAEVNTDNGKLSFSEALEAQVTEVFKTNLTSKTSFHKILLNMIMKKIGLTFDSWGHAKINDDVFSRFIEENCVINIEFLNIYIEEKIQKSVDKLIGNPNYLDKVTNKQLANIERQLNLMIEKKVKDIVYDRLNYTLERITSRLESQVTEVLEKATRNIMEGPEDG